MGQKRKSILFRQILIATRIFAWIHTQLRKKPLAKQCGQFKIQTIEWWFVRDCDVYLQYGYLYLVDGIRRVKRVVDLSPQQYTVWCSNSVINERIFMQSYPGRFLIGN